MWLINCRTLMLEEFMNHKEARYAILSHTWEKGEEVQYSEFCNRGATEKRGWQKIEKTCQLALDDGCDFAWVDTYCIDKTSSAELTEAINSMFPWHSGSEICYAYLADYDASDPHAEMSESRWFTRGWTLQELIAPARVDFFDKSWTSIGTNHDLIQQLSLITGIGHEVLLASNHRRLEETLAQLPIARKMSWAAKRETTRIEDTAYCLLGIFGINLPLLYGEGERAFIRLQEEIIKNSNDLSLLAWLSPNDGTNTNIELAWVSPINRTTYVDRFCGVFAQHPRYFEPMGKIALINDVKFSPDFTMTNKGLKIHTELHQDSKQDLHILEINCHDVAHPQSAFGIFLRHQGASVFARAQPHLLAMDFARAMKKKLFFLSKSIAPSIAQSQDRVHGCSSVIPRYKYEYWEFTALKPENLWDVGKQMFITVGLRDFVGCHEYTFRELPGWGRRRYAEKLYDQGFSVLFGYGYGLAPWVHIFSFSDPLRDDIKNEDWIEVALHAHSNLARHLDVDEPQQPQHHYDKTILRRKRILVKLERVFKGDEAVYWVQISSRVLE